MISSHAAPAELAVRTAFAYTDGSARMTIWLASWEAEPAVRLNARPGSVVVKLAITDYEGAVARGKTYRELATWHGDDDGGDEGPKGAYFTGERDDGKVVRALTDANELVLTHVDARVVCGELAYRDRAGKRSAFRARIVDRDAIPE